MSLGQGRRYSEIGSATAFEHSGDLPLGVPIFDVGPLIALGFRAAESDQNLHPTLLEVEPQRNDVEPISLSRLVQPVQLTPVQQQLSAPVRHVIVVPAPGLPRLDTGTDKKQLIADKETVAFRQAHLPGANRLHLTADETNPRFDVRLDGVVVSCPPILNGGICRA